MSVELRSWDVAVAMLPVTLFATLGLAGGIGRRRREPAFATSTMPRPVRMLAVVVTFGAVLLRSLMVVT